MIWHFYIITAVNLVHFELKELVEYLFSPYIERFGAKTCKRCRDCRNSNAGHPKLKFVIDNIYTGARDIAFESSRNELFRFEAGYISLLSKDNDKMILGSASFVWFGFSCSKNDKYPHFGGINKLIRCT